LEDIIKTKFCTNCEYLQTDTKESFCTYEYKNLEKLEMIQEDSIRTQECIEFNLKEKAEAERMKEECESEILDDIRSELI